MQLTLTVTPEQLETLRDALLDAQVLAQSRIVLHVKDFLDGPHKNEVLARNAELAAQKAKYRALLNDLRPSATFDFVQHLTHQKEWSAQTFGPGNRVNAVIDHIKKELVEVAESGGTLAEWVDVIILALDGAWRSGAEPASIVAAIVAKQKRNEGRTWPDWRLADPNKAIEHDRSADAYVEANAAAQNPPVPPFEKGGASVAVVALLPLDEAI